MIVRFPQSKVAVLKLRDLVWNEGPFLVQHEGDTLIVFRTVGEIVAISPNGVTTFASLETQVKLLGRVDLEIIAKWRD